MSQSFGSNIFKSVFQQENALPAKVSNDASENQEASSLPGHVSTTTAIANDSCKTVGRKDLLNFLNKPDVIQAYECSLTDNIQLHACPDSCQNQCSTYHVALAASEASNFPSGSKPSESENSGAAILSSHLITDRLQSIQNRNHLNSMAGPSSAQKFACTSESVVVTPSSSLVAPELPASALLPLRASLSVETFTAAPVSATAVRSAPMMTTALEAAGAESLQASSSNAVSEAEKRKNAKPQELRRLRDSVGYCAFVNIPETRERRKALALCRRLEKEELRQKPMERTCFRASLQQPRASFSQLSGRGRILKYTKSRISALRRQCKRQQAAFKRSVPSSAFARQPPSFQRYKSVFSTQFETVRCSLDPIVAATFDQDGTPTVDHVGRTSLHIAMGSFHKPTLQFIVEFFKTQHMLSCRDNANSTPLHIACCVGNYDAAELLLQAGASPNVFGGDNDCSPLHEAVSKEHLALVKLLVEFGADVTARDKTGRTILEIQTSSDVLNFIRCTMNAQQCASTVSEANAHKPMICKRKLPAIYVLQLSNSSDLKPFVLLSELCDSMNLSEECFRQRYQCRLNFSSMHNATIASRIINPFLRDSFERSASVNENSSLVEVDLTVRGLFDSISRKDFCSTVSQAMSKNFSDDDSYDTEAMFDFAGPCEDESQIQIDDMKELKRSVRRFELRQDKNGSGQSDSLVIDSTQEHVPELEHPVIESLSPAFHTQTNVGLKSKLVDLSFNEVREKFFAEDSNHHVLPVHRIETCERLPDVDLDLDSNTEVRATPNFVQCSRRKSHPLTSSRCERLKATKPSHNAQVALCSTEANPSPVSAPSIVTVMSASQYQFQLPNVSFWETSPDYPDLIRRKPEAPVSRCNDEPAAALAPQESIPPLLSLPSPSIESGPSRAVQEAQKGPERAIRGLHFNLDSHPGDIYAATRVKPSFAFSMLEACKVSKNRKVETHKQS